MKFFAYIHQSGGCDYTIECGSLLINLKAKTLKEAETELEKAIVGYPHLDSAMIIGGESSEVDLDAIYQKIEEEKLRGEEDEKEQKEREIYERLKKKYE